MIGAFAYNALPGRVVFAEGALSKLPWELDALGLKRAAILTTPQQVAQGDSVRAIIGTRAAAGYSGARMHVPIEVVDEEWYSEDLHINLLVRHFDPRVGVQTVGVSGLKREEPPASMFQVPLGYKIVDETPASPPEPTVPQPPAAGAVPNP